MAAILSEKAKKIRDVIKASGLSKVAGSDDEFEAAKNAARCLIQAAINVELFTIPLYMTAMKSVFGVHEINAENISYYDGRTWPGMATTATATTTNQKVYNILFSVFIDEMNHLQMACNMASALGVSPDLLSSELVDPSTFGWNCYGDDKTVIPHILDLLDTENYQSLAVKLDGLTADQVTLFTLIEQNIEAAEDEIKLDRRAKYYHKYPTSGWAGWSKTSKISDLPLFGSIAQLYGNLVDALLCRDKTGYQHVYDVLFDSKAGQRDMFNAKYSGHPMTEYPMMKVTVSTSDANDMLLDIESLINAIVNQGEGGNSETLRKFKEIRKAAVGEVALRNQPDLDALKTDYPSYDSVGKQVDSTDTGARYENGRKDHHERFEEVAALIQKSDFQTWAQWHQGGKWTVDMLGTKDGPSNIPTRQSVCDALNRLNSQQDMFNELSKVVSGAIAGITTVLTGDNWGNSKVGFPYPSMVGSGDRLALCWAIYGKAPDLSQGPGSPEEKLYHSCQGLDFNNFGVDDMPDPVVFHSCRGSNTCKARGGCGFVQSLENPGGCNTKAARASVEGRVLCGKKRGLQIYSAPGDNKCAGFGGCAVPISQSQLFPTKGVMEVFDVKQEPSVGLGTIHFNLGDSVYDTAWKAYCTALGKDPEKNKSPAPSDLRLALPPST